MEDETADQQSAATGDQPPARILITYYAHPAAPVEALAAAIDRQVYAQTEQPSVILAALAASAYAGGQSPRRVAPQRRALPSTRLAAPDPIFGADLDWPFRGYVVEAGGAGQPDPAAPPAPLGSQPPQPSLDPRPAPGPAHAQRLCLFNVLVALEWHPTPTQQRQLTWAFRRASDFLYDVSDGTMAFGQIVFAGPEWLAAADIQIMAANRFHPRSWTNGLHEPAKYMPIRVGRGIWSKSGQRTIPWDEPEAYRALIHEWAHYALGLKDEYLQLQPVNATTEYGPRLVNAAGPGRTRLVLPRISLPIRSIMATQQGTSELMAHVGQRRPTSTATPRVDEWREISQKPEFAFLEIGRRHQPSDGPWELPLPLPTFHSLPPTAPPAGDPDSAPAWGGALRLHRLPADLRAEHGWLYLVKGTLDRPQAIVAQGTLEQRSATDGFWLLGAASGDHLVLIGDDEGYRPRVWRTVITGQEAGGQARIEGWSEATPAAFPLIDVLPSEPTDPSAPVPVAVQITGPAGQRPERVTLAGVGTTLLTRWTLDGAPVGPTWRSPAQAVGTLDGHVLLSWDGGRQVVIATYSQGGGPASIGGVFDNPTTGGSAEGNAMVFFQTGGDHQPYSQLRLITTLVPGGPSRLPGLAAPNTSHPHSYTFSLASNRALPSELFPTLILFYEPFATTTPGDLRLYRHDGGERWVVLPTYLDPGAWLAAAPLHDPIAGRRLLADDAPPTTGRVERYRLYWTPRGSQLA